jgi:hypothetical protein
MDTLPSIYRKPGIPHYASGWPLQKCRTRRRTRLRRARWRRRRAEKRRLAGVRFSEHLAKGGPLIFALIAKSALLPNLRTLRTESKQGHLGDAQKKQVSAEPKGMREDGFDWSAAWGLADNVGVAILTEVRSSANSGETYQTIVGEPTPSAAKAPIAEDIGKYREYMAAVQAALNLSPDTSKARLLALESERRALPEAVQRLVPGTQKLNDARIEVFAPRNDLLESIAAK